MQTRQEESPRIIPFKDESFIRRGISLENEMEFDANLVRTDALIRQNVGAGAGIEITQDDDNKLVTISSTRSAGRYDVREFGEIGRNTDCTPIIREAWNQCYYDRKSLYLPGNTYKITSPLEFNNWDMDNLNTNFPSIIGDGAMGIRGNENGTVLKVEAGASGMKFHGYRASPLTHFYGGVLRDFTILSEGTWNTDTYGLFFQGCVDYRIFNVACMGFEYGFKNNYGWSWDWYGITATHNRVGVILENNSNACGIHGIQAHQNDEVGVKITGGTNILLNRGTCEGQDWGVVIYSDGTSPSPNSIKLDNIYVEQNSVGAILIGEDEDSNTSPSVIATVEIDTLTFSKTAPVTHSIFLRECNNIQLSNINCGYVEWLDIGDNVSNVKFSNCNYFTNEWLSSVASVEDKIGVKTPYNLLPNCHTKFPVFPFSSAHSRTQTWDTGDYDDAVMKMPVNNGDSAELYRLRVKVDERIEGKILHFSAFCKAGSDITTPTFTFYNDAGAAITGGSVALGTSYGIVHKYFTMPSTNATYLWLQIRGTNSSGNQAYIYLKHAFLTLDNSDTIRTSPFDIYGGFSGSLACVTGGTTVTITGWQSDMYEVLLQPYANFTAYVTKGNGSFVITPSVNGTVAYFIVPKWGAVI